MTKKGTLTEIKTKKIKRQTKIEKHFECKFFHRINPGAKDFFEISKMQGYIAQSNKEKLKKEKEAKIKELKEKLEKLEAQIKEPRNKNQKIKKKSNNQPIY